MFGSLTVSAAELERETGWSVTREGLCKADRCVAFGASTERGTVDLSVFAAAIGAPLVGDPAVGLWAIGPESGGRALSSAVAPELDLPDVDGRRLALSSLQGRKVLLVAWAPW